MVECLVWDQDAAGSSPVASTRLSLDAIRVPGSVFSFAFSPALKAGIFFVAQTTRLSLDAIRVPGSVFSFAFLPALKAGIFFVAQTKELSSTNGMFMPFVEGFSLTWDLWAV